MGRARDHDERRVELLEDVAVVVRHQSGELAEVVRHPVEIDAGFVFDGEGFSRRVQAEHRARRQHEGAAEIHVAIR